MVKPLPFFIFGLALLFIGLKLTDFIDWSWYWVLSPLLSIIGILFILIFIVGLLQVIDRALEDMKEGNK